MKTKKILAVLGAASVITAGLTCTPAMAAEEEGGGRPGIHLYHGR